MAQLHGTRGGLDPQHAQHLSQQQQQQQHRANIINSLSPGMVGGGVGVGVGQDMRHPSSGMSSGAAAGLADDVLGGQILQRKKAELNEIIERQQKLYSNLDSLDRQRTQILGDIDKTAALNFHLHGQSAAAAAAAAAAASRYPSQLRGSLPGNMQSPFATAAAQPSMHGGGHHHQMRQGPGGNGNNNNTTIGAAAAARDALHSRYPPVSTMDFLSNRSGLSLPSALENHHHHHHMSSSKPEIPPSLMNADDFAAGALGALRGRYESKMQEMGGVGGGGGAANQSDHLSGHHIDKRARLFGNALGENAKLRADAQKQQLARFATAKDFHNQRISSSYLPSEIMVTPKNPTAGDSLSVLSSSHQLLMSQRQANLQRENMLSYMTMNNGRNPIIQGMNRQRLHDGKLPETKRKLSKDFVPEVDTVVLGKGNIPKTNIGNLKLKGVVMDNLVEYANGERRKKIAVISRIISHVTNANYKTTGFVKFEDDCWWEMTERDARVKITALFRDCLHDKYRSSSSSKVKRRQELRKSRSLSVVVAGANKEKEDEKTEDDDDEDKNGDKKETKKGSSSGPDGKPNGSEEDKNKTNGNTSSADKTSSEKRKADEQ